MRPLILLALLAVLPGCGQPPSLGGPAPAPGAPGGDALCDGSPEGAIIRGKVSFEGTPPACETRVVEGDPFCVQLHKNGIVYEDVKVKDGALANVFVWVKKGIATKYPAPKEPKVLTQRECRFEPRVFGLQAGQPLVIRNDDETMHNVHAIPKMNDEFNFAQTKKGDEITKKFTSAEVMVRIKCDAHGWMAAWAGVVNHPFYAVTGEDGTFELKGLPPGEYLVATWHERFGLRDQTVKIGEKETKTADFTYKAE